MTQRASVIASQFSAFRERRGASSEPSSCGRASEGIPGDALSAARAGRAMMERRRGEPGGEQGGDEPGEEAVRGRTEPAVVGRAGHPSCGRRKKTPRNKKGAPQVSGSYATPQQKKHSHTPARQHTLSHCARQRMARTLGAHVNDTTDAHDEVLRVTLVARDNNEVVGAPLVLGHRRPVQVDKLQRVTVAALRKVRDHVLHQIECRSVDRTVVPRADERDTQIVHAIRRTWLVRRKVVAWRSGVSATAGVLGAPGGGMAVCGRSGGLLIRGRRGIPSGPTASERRVAAGDGAGTGDVKEAPCVHRRTTREGKPVRRRLNTPSDVAQAVRN